MTVEIMQAGSSLVRADSELNNYYYGDNIIVESRRQLCLLSL